MTQVSPRVQDGINLIYTVPLEGDVTVEVRIDGTELPAGNVGHFGFFDDVLAPMVNTDMHPHWVDVVYFNGNGGEAILNDGQAADGWHRMPVGQVAPGWHVWRVEVAGEVTEFVMDGHAIGAGRTVVRRRYFILSVDPYTTDYKATWVIDYVELTGDSVRALTVDPDAGLATAWGAVKASLPAHTSASE